MAEVQTKSGHLLERLGVPAESVDAKLLAKVPLQKLKTLGLAYGPALVDANKFTAGVTDGRLDIPPFGANPEPKAAMAALRRHVGRTYFRRPGEAKHPSSDKLMNGLFNARTQRGVKMARLLQTNAPVRTSFEKTAGAKVVLDSRNDGAISMRVPETGVSKSAMTGDPAYGGMPSKERIFELLAAMDAAVLEQAQKVQLAQNVGNQGGFSSLGDTSLYGPDLSGGTSQRYSSEEEGEEDGGSQSQGLGGIGFTPGGVAIGPGNPVNQPDARVESVDIATMHLKRLIDKKEQMYDLFRQVNDKHNQAANTAVNNMKA